MPNRISPGAVRARHATTPGRTGTTTSTATKTKPRSESQSFTDKPRSTATTALGRRPGGPADVSLSKTGDLLLGGTKSPDAPIEAARLVEHGRGVFANITEAQRSGLTQKLIAQLQPAHAGKSTSTAVLGRSAAATLLLALARGKAGPSRDAALAAYVKLMGHETNLAFKTSLFQSLEAAHLPLPKAQAATVDAVRAQLEPAAPPYDKWFKGAAHPKLEVRQYVMSDFWKDEAQANRARGFKAIKTSANEIVWERVLHDPAGKKPDVTVHMISRKAETNVLRDIDDPKVDMIIYAGHAQLGGVADNAVRTGPALQGDKLICLFNCRGQQSVAQFKEKYPEAQLSATYSSSYGSDDSQVLDQMFDAIAKRGTYDDVRKGLKSKDLIQGKKNYMLPDDTRQLVFHDDDMDGVRDSSPASADRFYDPSTRRASGGPNVFRPSAVAEDPEGLSGKKLDHAIEYANTAFFYFAEENHRAPLTVAQADTFVPNGWFESAGSEPVRVSERNQDGKTYYDISVNSRYADKNRAVITSMVLYEMQAYLSKKNGSFTADDKLRALVMVAGYLDLFEDYSDQINQVLEGFAKMYGITGPATYDVLYEAMQRDGEDHTASNAGLSYLKSKGVAAPG